MAKRNETYTEWYARKLGSVDRYSTMTVDELGRKLKKLQGDFGAILVQHRKFPSDSHVKEMLNIVEPHYEEVVKQLRKA
jgi:hypothetical protein